MDSSKYRYTLYVIVIVILSTIAIQAYWNYKNYLSNKQQLINDVQSSLDKAVDDYYANLAENSTLGFSITGMSQKDFLDNGVFDSIMESIDMSAVDGFGSLDSIRPNLTEGVSIIKGANADSIIEQMHMNGTFHFSDSIPTDITSIEIDSFSRYSQKKTLTQHSEKDLQFLTSKVIISMSTDSLSLRGIDTLLQSELRRKDIDIDYTIKYQDPSRDIDYYNWIEKNFEVMDSTAYSSYLVTTSKSAFLPKKSELSLLFNNISIDVFKRIVWGIFISTLLVLAVISCLFYLLKIIKYQKQLAEVKNDLISNITHEFKTPIATIGVALESIQNFNAIEDREKTKSYLDMSGNQLAKLNTMVEKLLETATLDSEDLELNTDTYNISEVITSIVEKHKLQHNGKTTTYELEPNVMGNVDIFHFENAINNIIDNAFKYGGDKIKVALTQSNAIIHITISDNGQSLTKVNHDRIFEKFYRVPKGNTHDVKGFGIGLYYTKKIIEKHDGAISLDLKNKWTTFKISLPNV